MANTEQISRTGLAWILIAQAAILMPHVAHAPFWLWLVWLPVVVWRWQIFRGAWSFPSRSLKIIVLAVCCAGLLLTLRGKFGMQAMVSLLLVGFILKLLEMKKRHDFLTVCYLGYFVIATQFLFFSNLFAALFGGLCIVLLTTALLAVNQSLGQQRLFRSLRLGSGLILQALPLMLLLFFMMPRIGPLWAVPMNNSAAKTGVSDSMSPGDFNQLMTSDELAFRATFSEGAPRASQLYWRGLVFSYFDGRRWGQANSQVMPRNMRWSPQEAQELFQQVEFLGDEFHYDIIVEPSRQPWLFSLSIPREWDADIAISSDLRLQKKGLVNQRFQYRVVSVTDYRYQAEGLEGWQYRQETNIPEDFNPRTREIARQWMAEAGSAEALIQRLLGHYRDNFTYTLRPSVLGRDSVDEFLWQTREGFCEHFSSSFVFFLRAAGIPARVVVGYQGGELNVLRDYWLVRQRDAHAWAEVWLDGRGWVRVDPTAAVAPDRIERGIDYSLSEEDSLLLGNSFARSSAWISQLSMRWDLINYNWSRWVLNYNRDQQHQFWRSWLGGLEPWRITLFVLGFGAVILLLLSVSFLWRQRPAQSPCDHHYRRFSKKLARLGLARATGESPHDYAMRVVQEHPHLKGSVTKITALYELANYAENRAAVADLAAAVRQFTPRALP